MNRRGIVLVVLVGVVSFVSGGWLLQRGSSQAGSVYQKARLFDDILAHVSDYYVDSVDERKLYDMAIDGMLEQLNDPYTTFLREKEYRDLTLNTTGNYAGLGIQIGIRDGWVTVIAPLPETPAERAGIQGGDRIIEVDGASTFGWKEEQAVRQLRGEAGTQVRVRLVRPGVSDSLAFTITRARIHVRSVEVSTTLSPGIGYLQLRTVGESSPQEVSDAINALRKDGARALIVDLRENPGGLLEQGVKLTDLFLEPGHVVVETRGRGPGATKSYSSETRQPWPDMPVVVLVNGSTASAAEIISGALQDHDRALIVGTPTFGKGLVQTLFQLSSNEALKITTARWYTPSGRLIQRSPKAGESPIAAAEAGAAPAGRSMVADSTRPVVYRTDAGRKILGGAGGIHPDVVVGSDTLTDAERGFAKALGSQIPAYRDVMTAYALDLKARGAIKEPAFAVTPVMRAELLRRLRDKGIQLPDTVWTGVRKFIDEQFSYEVTHYVFGKAVAFQRRASDDAQVQAAVDLLKRARTPRELFALAGNAVEAPPRPN
ncbi:MAG: S41 family peptidase [Gemmatimonadetes bacterium]|nr:S41 family peptidase [Gemmatimonadota bacterium]